MKVSIIIPVYNVFEWMDLCLESIVNQSFKEFEVILVNDGSTDGSKKKCYEWTEKDKRIQVISQENAGPSVARNNGIRKAKGNYLAFVDADDWIDKDFLLEMYQTAVQSDADIVECDFWRYNNNNGRKVRHVSYGCMEVGYTKEQHIIYGHTAIWKCLIKRSLFVDNDIFFPPCHSEARAIYPLLLVCANKIENIRKPLYYYRKFRKNSLSDKPRNALENGNAIGVQSLDALLEGFRSRGIYEKYEQILERFICYKLSDLLAGFLTRRTNDEYKRMVIDYQRFLQRQFSRHKQLKYITFGGYNLNRIAWKINLLHIAYLRFNFSSLISIMNPIAFEETIVCQNKYRKFMVNRDFSAEFWKVLEQEKPDFIIMDFIEERFDMISYCGGYLTKSDAYDDCDCDLPQGHIIKRNSKECSLLWEKSCLEFIKELESCFSEIKVILVKNYLSERVGNIKRQSSFENLVEIREINRLLKNYYDFFEKHCLATEIIEVQNKELYFTDEEYEYGAVPSHLNELVNGEIAEMIEWRLERMYETGRNSRGV